MAKIADAMFQGKTGTHSFEVYPINANFNPVAAVYIFTKRTVDASGKGSHEFIYIGQTDSLADRIPNHDKRPCVRRNGANCICVHRDNNERSRLNKETDLRAASNTLCNDE